MSAKRFDKEKGKRRYINLVGENDYVEEEDMDLDSFDYEDEKCYEVEESNREKFISDICFFGGLLLSISMILGVIVLIGRILVYPFIRKFAKDCDW